LVQSTCQVSPFVQRFDVKRAVALLSLGAFTSPEPAARRRG
jgi:hypothetical protein